MDDLRESLLDDIYEAAITPALWQQVVEKIKLFCPESNVEIMLYDQVSSKVPWFFNTLEPSIKKQYEDHYSRVNSMWPIMKNLEYGKVSDTDYFDVPNQVKHTEFYNDYMLRHNWGYGVGGNISFDPTVIGACVIGYNGKISRSHTAPGCKVAEDLLPHLQRSFYLARCYGTQQTGQKYREGRVDGFSDPAFLVGKKGVIEYMNGAAERVLRAMRGVKSGLDNRLHLCDSHDNEKYVRLLANIFMAKTKETGLGSKAMSGCVMFRANGEPGLNVLAVIPSGKSRAEMPLPYQGVKQQQRAIVVLQYSSDKIRAIKTLLETSFGLTPTEANIALAMMVGMSVEDYAKKNKRSPATIKKQLAQVYFKTNTHHKGELVSLLHNYKDIFSFKNSSE